MPPFAIDEAIRPVGLTLPAAEEHRDSTSGAAAARCNFIDLLRGFALVLMIETHVVHSYLPLMARKGSSLFFWLSFTNGLVAPAFLFAAGFSLVLQSDRHWNDWTRFRLPFWIQMRRLGFILLVAYYCHLQGFKLSRYLSHWNDEMMWRRTFQVDVLQCIVISLLVVHAVIAVVRRKELLPWGLGLVAVAVAAATPWMWAHDFRSLLPLGLALFLNPHGISLFPLFPWICFILSGSLAACIFLKSVRSDRLIQFMKRIAFLGAAMIVGALLLRDVAIPLPGRVHFYTTSPLFLMIRIGCVLLVCTLLYRIETKTHWALQLIRLAGRESLLVYGVHLWLIYALLRGKRLSPILGLQFSFAGCLVMSAILIVLMLFLARYWHDLKKHYPRSVRYGQAVIVAAMLASFLLN